MDTKSASLIDEGILATVRQRYAIGFDGIRPLSTSANVVYEFTCPDGQRILRLVHSTWRSIDLVRGELDWINYLSDHEVAVARALPSAAGNLVEPISDGRGGQFFCTAFEKAHGGRAGSEHIKDRFVLNYGRLLGHMHVLAKDYVPSDPAWKRYAWDAPVYSIPAAFDRQLPEGEGPIRQRYRKLLAYLRTLPRDRDSYGMIHQDAHLGNLSVADEYRLTLFDFDDCAYGHFAYDIAVVLFYISISPGIDDVNAFVGWFLSVFLRGYRGYNHIDPRWLRELPSFLKLREIDLFSHIQNMMADAADNDVWATNYMQGRRTRIENDLPVIDYDWDSLADFL